MKKRQQRRYIDKEWAAMKACLKSWFKKELPEDLHRFRVQVKKLRAFLILTDSAAHHPKRIKLFKPVRKIFRQAGEIRNAYMNQELARAQQSPNEALISSQHRLQVKASRKFKSGKVRFPGKLKGTRRLLKKKIKPVSDLHIGLFYQTQLEQTAGFLGNLQFDERLHACRKQVKTLIYNYKPARAALNNGFNEAYLEQVQAAIGDWHDHVLAIALFSSEEVKDKAAVARLKTKDGQLKRKITVLTKDFYNRATTVVDLPVEQLS